MTVSVRMPPLLGHKERVALYHEVMEEAARSETTDSTHAVDLSLHEKALRKSLQEEYLLQQDEYAAYLIERDKQSERRN